MVHKHIQDTPRALNTHLPCGGGPPERHGNLKSPLSRLRTPEPGNFFRFLTPNKTKTRAPAYPALWPSKHQIFVAEAEPHGNLKSPLSRLGTLEPGNPLSEVFDPQKRGPANLLSEVLTPRKFALRCWPSKCQIFVAEAET